MAEYHKYIKYVSCVKFADMTVKRRYRKGYYYVKKILYTRIVFCIADCKTKYNTYRVVKLYRYLHTNQILSSNLRIVINECCRAFFFAS